MSEAYKADKLYKILQKLDIRYKCFNHPKITTCKDALEEPTIESFRNISLKNIFVSDSSKRYYLISAFPDTEVSWKTLRKHLNNNKLHMGDEKDMERILGVTRGSLTPFSVMNDTENFCPPKLLLPGESYKSPLIFNGTSEIAVHPLHNEASTLLKFDEMLRFLREFNHDPTFIPLNEEDTPKEKTEAASGSNKQNNKNDLNILGITAKKAENFAEWYTQAIVRGGMIEYYDISGCYIYLPWSYYIWETFQEWFNTELKKRGVDNCYFPMFVSKDKLEAEKEHIEGFSPEVAWVTKYGDSEFQDPIAIRPTSETIMYPEYSKWIRSHRDLPLKLNQWNSVVRWEFKQPTPFIRSREFLWQEGHTAHTSEDDALHVVHDMLNVYKKFYEEYLCVPVIKGVKSEGEKFAGGKMTTTLEAFIPDNGRGIQAATSHLLGTNFAKLFDIQYEDDKGVKNLVHQTSWGFTTRSIGVMIMVHGDDKGIVLPPKVAKLQVIIIPILSKKSNKDAIMERINSVYSLLKAANVRVDIDDRTGYTPGFKFNHWELRGVPIRLEIGSLDVENNSCKLVRRDTGAKEDAPLNNVQETVATLLDDIQTNLFNTAKKKFDESILKIYEFKDVMDALDNNKLVLTPWCEDPATEDEIKLETQKLSQNNVSGRTGAMKSLCIPMDQPDMPDGTKCFWTGKPAKKWALWGRSY